MKKQPIRTTFTLLVDFMKEFGGEPMKQKFLREISAYIKSRMVVRPLTEEEYQFGLKKMREELPAYKQYLAQCRLEPLPGGGVLFIEP